MFYAVSDAVQLSSMLKMAISWAKWTTAAHDSVCLTKSVLTMDLMWMVWSFVSLVHFVYAYSKLEGHTKVRTQPIRHRITHYAVLMCQSHPACCTRESAVAIKRDELQ